MALLVTEGFDRIQPRRLEGRQEAADQADHHQDRRRDRHQLHRQQQVDIGDAADLSNIGTLFAFVLVSLGVIFLRQRQPNRPRGFRVPLRFGFSGRRVRRASEG